MESRGGRSVEAWRLRERVRRRGPRCAKRTAPIASAMGVARDRRLIGTMVPVRGCPLIWPRYFIAVRPNFVTMQILACVSNRDTVQVVFCSRSDVSVSDMLGALFGKTYSAAVVRAALVALLLVAPVLWAAYLRHATRALSPDFSLRRLEAFELDRAEAVYKKISQRLSEIDQLAQAGTGTFWQRIKHRAQIREQYREETEISEPALIIYELHSRTQAPPDPEASKLGPC